MDARSFRNIGPDALNGFKNNGLMRKTVANLVAVFFIFNGTPVPTSFADAKLLTPSNTRQTARAVTLAEANARSVDPAAVIPSGVAIKTQSPLSVSVPATVEASVVPEGWTRAESNMNYAYKITPHGTSATRFERLETMDLATRETKIIHEASVIPGQVSYTGKVDVSPDGQTVVTECRGTLVPEATWVEIYSVDSAQPDIQVNIQYAGLKAIEFPQGKVLIRVNDPADAYYEVDLATQEVKFFYAVPEGWTRAASNVNFAFRVTTESIVVRNLVTGEFSVPILVPPGTEIGSVYDVSPDGSVFIFSTQTYTYVERFDDTDSLLLQGAAESLSFVADDAPYAVILTATSEIRVDLSTLTSTQQPRLPEGWTRAESNANFALRMAKEIDPQQPSVEMNVLQAMDLRTGEITLVENFWAGDGLQVWNYDISPDSTPGGVIAFYEIGMPNYEGGLLLGYDDIVIACRLRDPRGTYTPMSERVIQPGAMLKSISFDLFGRAVVTTVNAFRDGTQLESAYTLDLASLELVSRSMQLVQQGKLFVSDTESGYGVLILPVSESDHGMVFDISAGTDQMTPVVWSEFSLPAGFDRISFGNVFESGAQSSPHNLIVSLSFTNGDGLVRKTVIRNFVFSDPEVVFDGWSIESFRNVGGNTAVYQLKNASNEMKWVAVDLVSLQVVPLPVPAGWTRAASNANFAFRINRVSPPHATTIETLYLMDLRTGEQTALLTCGNSSEPSRVSLVYDVSPDGALAVFGKIGPFEHDTAFVKNLQTGAQLSFSDSALAGASFFGGGAIDLAVIHYAGSQLWLREEHKIQADPLEVKGTVYSIQYSGFGVYEDADASLLITPLNATSNFYVFDTTNGTSEMSLLRKWAMSEATYVKFSDAYKLSSGARIISLGCARAGGSYSVIFDALSGRSLELTGEIASVTYEGPVARYGVSQADGTQVIQFVDLNTLQVIPPPVPAGWTRAASNMNFAFKIEKVGSYAQLKLLDVQTGKTQILTKALIGRWTPHPIRSVYDVSRDGTTVIYGTSSMTYIQKIAAPAKRLTLSGALKAVSFIGQIAEITKTNGTKQWVNMDTLKVVPRPLPDGWQTVPSIPTLAYQTISGNKVRVMDLWTGNISEKPVSQNQTGIRTGLYYVMTSTGLKEIYAVRVGRGTVLRSYDPVTKKWAFW